MNGNQKNSNLEKTSYKNANKKQRRKKFISMNLLNQIGPNDRECSNMPKKSKLNKCQTITLAGQISTKYCNSEDLFQ